MFAARKGNTFPLKWETANTLETLNLFTAILVKGCF